MDPYRIGLYNPIKNTISTIVYTTKKLPPKYSPLSNKDLYRDKDSCIISPTSSSNTQPKQLRCGGSDVNPLDKQTFNLLQEANMISMGDQPFAKGGDVDDDDLDSLITNIVDQPSTVATHRSTSIAGPTLHTVELPANSINVQSMEIFDDDTMVDIKTKIYLTLGIPIYRQHIFAVSCVDITTSYNIFSSTLINIDIRRIFGQSASFRMVEGVPIDADLYNNHDTVQYDDLDAFTLSHQMAYNRILFLVDLQSIIRLSTDIVGDAYKLEQIYYGFVSKFFPMVNMDMFKMIVTRRESDIAHSYPLLLPPTTKPIKHRYSRLHDVVSNTMRHEDSAYGVRTITTIVTNITVSPIDTPLPVNLRYIFDNYRLSNIVPMMMMYVQDPNTPINNILVTKTYRFRNLNIVIPQRIKSGLIIVVSMNKADQAINHLPRIAHTRDSILSRYLYINIMSDGTYNTSIFSPEKNAMSLCDGISTIISHSNPVIDALNKTYRFFSTKPLPLFTRNNYNIININISIVYGKSISSDDMRDLLNAFNPLAEAHVMRWKYKSVHSSYMLFLRGIYNYNIEAFRRIVEYNTGNNITNTFEHYFNHAINAKWDYVYHGRIIEVKHRSTDVIFNIMNINEAEYDNIYRYISVILWQFKPKPNTGVDTAVVNKLRRLQKNDPDLFDLKRHNIDAIYSVKCQKKQQPFVYADANSVPAGVDKKRLYKLHNVTRGDFSYYECPKAYPNITFKVGLHPDGWCLPCCDMGVSREGSIKHTYTTECLKTLKYDDGGDRSMSDNITSYILRHTKKPMAGRLSEIHPDLQSIIMGSGRDNNASSSSQTDNKYFVSGLEQHGGDMQLIWCIAKAMGSLSVESVIADIKKSLRQADHRMLNTLINGQLLEYYDGNKEGYHKMIDDLFEERSPIIRLYNTILYDICMYIYNIYIIYVTYHKPDGNADPDITLDITPTSKLYMLNGADNIQILLINKNKGTINPIFKRVAEAPDHQQYLFAPDDLMGLLAVIKSNDETIDLSLSLVESFVEASKFKIISKYINKQHLCYGVMVSTADSSIVYLPCNPSPFNRSKTDIYGVVNLSQTVGGKKISPIKLSTLLSTIEKFNAYMSSMYKKGGSSRPPPFIVVDRHIANGKTPIGMVSKQRHLYLYNIIDIKVPWTPWDVKCDYSEINRLIYTDQPPSLPKDFGNVKSITLYNNIIYQLLKHQVFSILSSERNTKIRSKISKCIADKRMDCIQSIIGIDDFITIKNQLSIYKYRNIQSVVDLYLYEFDYMTLHELKTLPQPSIIDRLGAILTNSVKIIDEGSLSISTFPNIYNPCNIDSSQPFCKGRTLMITQKNYDNLLPLLASEIKTMASVKHLNNVIDVFRFNIHRDEYIKHEIIVADYQSIYKTL